MLPRNVLIKVYVTEATVHVHAFPHFKGLLVREVRFLTFPVDGLNTLFCEVSCPNDCSGHGRCVSVGDLSKTSMLKSLYREKQGLVYGTGAGFDTIAWDFNTIYGCVCDSSWPVGYGKGETQLAEYFGPDCSLSKLA